MANDEHWEVDRAFERDSEREPARLHERRRNPPLDANGTLKTAYEQSRTEQALTALRKDGLL